MLTSAKFRIAISVLFLCISVAYLVSRDDCCFLDSDLLLATAAIQPVNMAVLATVALRFMLLARPLRIRFWPCFKASILATGINILAPARGGDFVRLTYLRQREGIPLGTGISISIIERVADLIVLSAIAIVLTGLTLLQSQMIVPIAAVVVLGGGLIFVYLFLPFIVGILRRLFPAVAAEFIVSVVTETAARIRDGKIFLALAASAAFMWLGLVATMIFFQIATGREFPFALAVMVLVFATLGGAIPILPGGLATFEAGVMAALIYGGYSSSEALQLAVVFRLQQFVLATPLALLIVARERLGLSAMFAEMYQLFVSRRGLRLDPAPASPLESGAGARDETHRAI